MHEVPGETIGVDAEGTASREDQVFEQPLADRLSRPDRWWSIASVAPAIVLLLERVLILTRNRPTAADETLYLMQALHWLDRLDKVSPDLHRTRGVPALIYPLARFTDATWVYRLEMTLLSLGLYWIIYLIGRRFLSRTAAAWSALMMGLFGTTLFASVNLLPDLPAAVAIATAFLLYWLKVLKPAPGEPLRGLWMVSVPIAAAFYTNIAFAAFAGVALAIDFVVFRRRELLSRATVKAVAVLGLLIGPYFVRVFIDHGDPFYTLRVGLGGDSGNPPGYVVYTRYFWDGFGRFWGAAIIVGVAFLALSLIRGTPVRRRDAALLGFWLTVPTLATAFIFHAEARYMMPWLAPVFLCLGLPVDAALRAGARLARTKSVRVLATGAFVALLVSAASLFGINQYRPVARHADRWALQYPIVHRTAELLGERLAEPPCFIFGRFPRELELHTGCRARYYRPRTEAMLLEQARANAEATFFVRWSGPHSSLIRHQPAYLGDFLKRYAVLAFTVPGEGPFGTGYVYAFFEPG